MTEKSFESEWRARFDRFAARGGSDARISGWSSHGLDRRLEALSFALDHWPPAPGCRIVDLGCGTGIYCFHLRERGYRAIGADYSQGMLRRAQAAAIAVEGLAPIPLAAADILRLPFVDTAFGGLVNVGVLQHVQDARRAFAEFARVLEPGAVAYVVTLNRRSLHALAAWVAAWPRAWLGGRLRPRRHAVRRTAGRLAEWGREVGLEPVRVRGVYLFPRGFGWLERLLDRLDSVRGSRTLKPSLLPLANAFMIVLRRRG